jgi:glycosyltransferase involved in cell wall biosynthesis
MESILHQLNGSYEVVVCDNCSNDGSKEVLQEYARRGAIRLIVERSSRGKGRQIAFENSTGNYIISGIDTDDRLKPTLKEFLNRYHRDHEGYMLSADTIHIIPRQLVQEIGGWRDLKCLEDVDFGKRAKNLGKLHELEVGERVRLVERGRNKRSFVARIVERYNVCQCAYIIDVSVFDQVKRSNWFYKPMFLAIAVVSLTVFKCKHIKKFEYN